ncbi:MAG: hemin ABC transporter substrate-binding protein [Brachymonas sp.]|jgi:iron complex transport system substrate-binding protein
MNNKTHTQQARRQWLQGLASLGGLGAVSSLLPLSALAAAPNIQASASKQRIVSIGGALTEIIYALGAQGDLVGVDTTSIYPAAASQLPSVGYARSLAAEGILALAPSHIIATEDAGPPTVIGQLQKTGLPVSILPAEHRYEGVIARIEQVGKIVDKEAQAAALVARLQADWQRIAAPLAVRPGLSAKVPKVLFVLSHSPSQIVVGGSDTAAQAMIEYAGARNAIQGMKGFKPLNPEALIAAAPDVILFTDQGWQAIGGAAGALRLPGVAQSTAGQKRRFVSLDAMFLLGFGPRIPQAVQALNLAIAKAMQA